MKTLLKENANIVALFAILILIVLLDLAIRGESDVLTPENQLPSESSRSAT
jgi:hypothetical protein